MLYPEDLDKIKAEGLIKVFLRIDPLDRLTEYDTNYILNQIEASNYFYKWYCNPDLSFKEMLCEQHAIAALGLNGQREYRIKGFVRSRTLGSSNWDLRDHFAGLSRDKLDKLQIAHPATDLLRIKKSDYFYYMNEPFFSEIYNPCENRISTRSAKKLSSIVDVSNRSFPHFFVFRVNEYFYLKHPKGEAYVNLEKDVTDEMFNLLALKNREEITLNELASFLASYYQLFILWMPFAHINNSLVWEQINGILQFFEYNPVCHDSLDQYALLLSTKNFTPLFRSHIISKQ